MSQPVNELMKLLSSPGYAADFQALDLMSEIVLDHVDAVEPEFGECPYCEPVVIDDRTVEHGKNCAYIAAREWQDR